MEGVTFCVLQGELVPEAEACIPVLDRGFLYGDGIFETFRTYAKRPFLLRDHWERLTASAAFLGIGLPKEDPARLVARVLEANDLVDASIRMTLTRGAGSAGPRPLLSSAPKLLVQARALRPDLNRLATEGVEARRLPWPLRARGLPLQSHKTLAYLSSILALGAVAPGIEPILETTEGHLSEGATGNIFWAKAGRLFTPALEAGCLPGVTRAVLLRLAASLEIPTAEVLHSTSSLAEADEAFLSNSVIELVPVVRFEGRPIGSGTPGQLTRRLQSAYQHLRTGQEKGSG